MGVSDSEYSSAIFLGSAVLFTTLTDNLVNEWPSAASALSASASGAKLIQAAMKQEYNQESLFPAYFKNGLV